MKKNIDFFVNPFFSEIFYQIEKEENVELIEISFLDIFCFIITSSYNYKQTQVNFITSFYFQIFFVISLLLCYNIAREDILSFL